MNSFNVKWINEFVSFAALGIFLACTPSADGYGIYACALAPMGLLMGAAVAGILTLFMREVAAIQARVTWN